MDILIVLLVAVVLLVNIALFLKFRKEPEKDNKEDDFAKIKTDIDSLKSSLNDSFRQQIEEYCFLDLEVNMIRFFVYHDLEPENDNDDPYTLDESQLDWTRYDSESRL